MKKKPIDPLDYVTEIVKGMKKAALLTTRRGDEVNTMTISWGKIGFEWNKLIFLTYIRHSRYTHEMLEASGEFTVNVPFGSSVSKVGKIMGLCGTKSGRDVNKVKELNLTPVPGDNVSAPGFLEVPLTLECRVIYKQDQNLSALSSELVEEFYPADPERDIHTMYYGEVLGAYIAEK